MKTRADKASAKLAAVRPSTRGRIVPPPMPKADEKDPEAEWQPVPLVPMPERPLGREAIEYAASAVRLARSLGYRLFPRKKERK